MCARAVSAAIILSVTLVWIIGQTRIFGEREGANGNVSARWVYGQKWIGTRTFSIQFIDKPCLMVPIVRFINIINTPHNHSSRGRTDFFGRSLGSVIRSNEQHPHAPF